MPPPLTPAIDSLPAAEPGSTAHVLRGLVRLLAPALGLALVFALFSVLRPQTFPTLDNIVQMFRETAVVGIAALGMTLIIISGGIDLAVGSQIALSVVSAAWFLRAGWPPSLAVAGAMGVGVGAGLLTGSLVTGFRLPPFIVTLGTLSALRGLAIGIAGGTPIYVDEPTWIDQILAALPPERRWMLFPPGVWAMLLLALLTALMLRYTRFGRHVFAVGSNEQTARLCGVPVGRVKVLVYCLGGLCAGIAGVLQFSYVGIGDMTTAGGYELAVIAAVVIGGASLSGGQGSVLGSLLGALIMTVIANGCTKLGLENWVQQIVTGGIIVLAVALDRLRGRAV